MGVDGVTRLDQPRLPALTATTVLLILAGSVLLFAADIAATGLLWRASLLHLRSLVLVAAALLAHARVRSAPSALVAILHLAALESCVTDLMAIGSWAIGWAPVSILHPATPAVGALVLIAISTALDRRRLQAAAPLLRRWWPVVLVGSLCGTSLGRAITPSIVWIAVGAVIGTLALLWTIDLHGALGGDGDAHAGGGVTAEIWTREWRWPLAAWAVLASVVISRLVFQAVPHVPDEVAYWFQAKYFAVGHLWLPAPPDARAFALPHVADTDGKWYSIFPPGWPAVLALAIKAGIPTLINPLLAGLTIVVLFPLLRRLYGVVTANVACALLALSPMFLLMSGGLMAHPLSALLLVCAIAALHRAWRDRSVWFALLTGVPLGWLTLTRTFEGILVCLAFGVYALTRWPFLRANRLIAVSLAVPISAVAIGALLLPYQRELTGSALRDPITKYFDAVYYPHSNRLGFGPDIANFGWGTDFMPGHSPLEAMLNAQLDGQLIHTELFGWAVGSLAPLVLYIMWRRQLFAREDALFLAIPAIVVIGQGFYWYAGADYGARYWYQVLVPCCVLAAKVVSHADPPPRRLAPTALILSAIGVFIFVPWRAATKYTGYRGMSDSVVRLVRDCPMTHGVVLVRDATGDAPFGVYSAAAILNRAGFAGDEPIFARDIAPEVTDALRVAFPTRPVWTIAVSREPLDPARIVTPPAGQAAAACQGADAGSDSDRRRP
jgi:hypothetical protein